MERTFWHKQSAAKPLFEDLLWSRPQNKRTAGKLLIVGGNAQGFVAPANAFRAAEAAGIGSAQMLLPDSMKPFVGKAFTGGELAPTTPSGSFSQLALGQALQMAQWADGVLLAGDLGRNSETAILLEKFLEKFDGQVTLTQDAVDYVTSAPGLVLDRSKTCLVLSFAQLQKLATSARFPAAFTFDMDLLRLVDTLHQFTNTYALSLVTKRNNQFFVSVGGEVSSTALEADKEVWRVETAAHTATWWLQNPAKAFEALTTAVHNIDRENAP